jgi:anti-sigma regulatory factor (Ser/Thr protein kinase)
MNLPPNDEWRTLAYFSLPSKPGQDVLATKLVNTIISCLELAPERIEHIKTAVGEATMNAIEHGHQYDPEKFVSIELQLSAKALSVSVINQTGPNPIPTPAQPDLKAKIDGIDAPRGWGLFLIQNLVDDLQIYNDEAEQVLQMIVHLE